MTWRQRHLHFCLYRSNHRVEYLFSPALTFSSLFKAKESQLPELLWTVFNYSIYLNAVMRLLGRFYYCLLIHSHKGMLNHQTSLNLFLLFFSCLSVVRRLRVTLCHPSRAAQPLLLQEPLLFVSRTHFLHLFGRPSAWAKPGFI